MAGTAFSNIVINFVANTKEALSQITGFQQKFQNSVGQIKTMVAGFIGYQGLRGAYNSLTNLVNTAEELDLPVEKVSRFANLFSAVGGTTEEATESLKKFDEMSRSLRFHSSGPLRELSAILRTNLNNKDYKGLINSFRSQFALLDEAGRREVEKMLGVDSIGLRRILRMNNDEFAKAIERAKQFKVVTNDEAKSIRDMEKAFAEVKQTLTMAALPILQALIPIVNVIKDLARAFNNLDAQTQKLIAFGVVGLTVAKNLGILKLAFDGLTGVAAALGVSLGTILGTITAIAAAIYAVYEAYKLIKDGFALEEQQKNRTKEDKAYLSNRAAIVLGDEDLFQNQMVGPISKAPAEISTSPYDWAGKQSNIEEPTMSKIKTTDVIQNINIYGVKNAEDMMDKFKGVVTQGLPTIMGTQG